MAEMNGKVVTRDDVRANAASAFGLDQPSVFDVVNRSAFATDDAYIDALVAEQMKRNSPEYQEARRKLAREYAERSEMETRQAHKAEYQAIRGKISLDSVDVANIDKEAVEKARRDLAAGRIGASQLGDQIARYSEQLTETRKNERAANAMMNRLIRSK